MNNELRVLNKITVNFPYYNLSDDRYNGNTKYLK